MAGGISLQAEPMEKVEVDMINELKPCPFCGGKAEIKTAASKICSWVKCTVCGSEGPAYGDKGRAKEEWNRRTAK